MNKLIIAVACTFLILFLSAPSSAGDRDSKKLTIETGINHAFQAGIKGTDTRVSSTRYGIKGSYSYFTLAYNYTQFSWSKAGDSGLSATGRTPWKGLHDVSLSASKNFFLNRQWMLTLGAGLDSAFEKEISDSTGAWTRVGLTRIFDNGWSAGIGVFGLYHPVGSMVLPSIGLGYAPTGDQGFSARIGFPATEVRYGFSDRLAARAYTGYTVRVYRLKNNSQVQDKGYFSQRALRLGMEMEVKPVPSMTLAFGPYYLMDRQWKTYSKNNNRVDRKKVKDSPGVGMDISWKF
jgi:hypothetical protein